MPEAEADALLTPFLAERDETAARGHLGQLLVEVAAPVLRRVLTAKTGGVPAGRGAGSGGLLDPEDLTASAQATLVKRLWAMREGTAAVVRDFRAYCAAIASSVWVDQLRLLRPGRARLVHQVRYLLEGSRRSSGFACWLPRGVSEEMGGFSVWERAGTPLAPAERLRALAEDPAAFVADALPEPADAARISPARLLAILLDRLGGPAPLEALTDAVGALWDLGATAQRDEPRPHLADLPSDLPGPDDAASWREGLSWLWREVRALPLPQRLAFVLHAEVTPEWEHAGIARRAEISAALGLSREELDLLWPDIPLPDADTAARLGVPRQTVINLRRAARVTLGRKFSATQVGIFPSSPPNRP